ncbi:hypothetical protein AGMMS50268_32190 [Spirochaetia bacterium]|nr:hypothetical protein AGMMS50268_32190 [Spirochaetia bacterium]
MEEKIIYNQQELFDLVAKAKLRIRLLGAVSFDLPYDRYKDDWFNQINAGKLQVEIICESEASLSYASLISSNRRVSGEKRSYDIGNLMNLKTAPLQKVREYLKSKGCKHIEPEKDSKEKQFFSLRTCYLSIPTPVINIDDDYYITQTLTRFCSQEKFEKITEENIWYNEYKNYFGAYFENELGAKKYSTEITTKGGKTEVILMYNDSRHVLGQLPRDSFLDTTKVKVVVWGMLFSREGKVLISQRGLNAKDNRGMWDKSIGGHVDLEKDTVDTSKAAAREMLEELYKVEAEAQGKDLDAEKMKINEDLPIYLGEWRREIRNTFPFSEIKKNKEEYYFFRIKYNFSKTVVDSPRFLPDESESPVKCFADVYVFVMPENFKDTIKDLKNSQYKLLELYELNDCYLDKQIEVITMNEDKIETRKVEKFNPTPDLKKIITGDLWAELNSFADYLKEGLTNK